MKNKYFAFFQYFLENNYNKNFRKTMQLSWIEKIHYFQKRYGFIN